MSGTLTSPLVKTEDLCVYFGGTKAVHQVSLALEPGRLYGLIGPNGSGKSTMLGAISRLTRITSGRLSFDGQDCTDASPQQVARRGLRRTFQTGRLLPQLTVFENVALGADARLGGRSLVRGWLDVPRTQRVERASRLATSEALERLGLTDLGREYPQYLSYGTQRRVEIARAIAAKPLLLLLDEPTAGMTREERDAIGSILLELRRDGLTQLLVEHDVPMITGVCDELFVMNMGELIASGNPTEVVRLPEVQEAYLGRESHAAS
jgi:ABC-type branched-subunit amino acid transport system ATPase component